MAQHRIRRSADEGQVAGAEAPLRWQIGGGVQQAQAHLQSTPSLLWCWRTVS